MNEIWKDVVGFEGLYEVSDQGNVRSCDRVLPLTRALSGGGTIDVPRFLRGRLLRPGTVKSGHQIVILGRGNGRLVHKLVLEAFVGPAPQGYEACHGDGDPKNNALSNLRWGSRSDNVQDRLAHGKTPSGLCTADVVQIKALFPSKSNREIADQFGVTPNCVSLIRCGHTWRKVA